MIARYIRNKENKQNTKLYKAIDFQHTYLVIFPQASNLILVVIHARPAYELLDHSGFINQIVGECLNDFYIIS